MTLFLDGIYTDGNKAPSAVTIFYPVVNEQGKTADVRHTLTGLIVSEPTVSSSNRWGPILNDVTNIQDVASLLGSENMWSWIGASVMCWKGTDPIKTSVDLYLINYKRGLNFQAKLKELNFLTALRNIGKKVAVSVHGGYAARVLETNQTHFNNGLPKRDENTTSADWVAGALAPFELNEGDENWVNMEQGTIQIVFGKKMQLRNMLLQRLDVTPSIVEVPTGEPLYYKVSMSLIGSRPLLSTDVDGMYL